MQGYILKYGVQISNPSAHIPMALFRNNPIGGDKNFQIFPQNGNC
jgi:hypothetical protein